MSATTKVTQTDLRVELRRTCIRRFPCLFCGGETDKSEVQAMVVETDAAGEHDTFDAACRRCLALTPAELRQVVMDQAARRAAFASYLTDLASNLPALPTLAALQTAEREADDEILRAQGIDPAEWRAVHSAQHSNEDPF